MSERRPRPSFVLTRIRPLDDGTFRPDPNGTVALTVGVDDREGNLVDFAAFYLQDLWRWWLRRGDQTPVLGLDAVSYAEFYQRKLLLCGTPFDWLLARGRGAVVLDWGCDLSEIFAGVPMVECQSEALTARVRESMRRWEPVIRTRAKEARCAA